MDNALYDSISEEIGEQLAADSGRVPVVTCTIEGELDEADLARYCQMSGNLPAQKSDEKDLASLRARHHQVARFLAMGLPEGLVAELTNFGASYISTLKQSPSMIELISHYRAPGDNATKLIAEKLRLLADMSLEQLIEKVQNKELDVNQLLASTKLGADRSNNGPMAKVEHAHQHNLNEEQVRKLSETARRRDAERIIDISAVRESLPAPKQSNDDAG